MEKESKKVDLGLTAALQTLDLQGPQQMTELAYRELADYQDKMQRYARMAVGSGTLGSLFAGGFFLFVSIVGMARRSLKYRRRMGWAFASLLLCLVSLPLSKQLATSDLPLSPNPFAHNQGAPAVSKTLDPQRQLAAKAEKQPDMMFLPIGVGKDFASSARKQQFPPLPIQQFVFNANSLPADVKAPETLLWQPVLSVNGQAWVSFDLPREPGIYQVRVEGHSSSGRLGLAEHIIDTRSESK